MINNIDNMKKIAKENRLIIDQLEIDVDFVEIGLKYK